jgi:hypothetical protein
MRKPVRLARHFAVAAVLGALSVGVAQAQSFYYATFTLPFEVRWGGAVLPAGDYRLAMNGINEPLNVIDGSGRVRVLVYGIPDPPTDTQPSSLLITRDGAERTVRSFNCPAWGYKFVYKPFTRVERDLLANGQPADAVPVRMASR